ncbi:hypothetical protein Glove_243g79 [Diversispora epigaea]|uniref:CBM20 domain-containing protein n=1 Tax=Diversispora epigaea TaxID=1348612 RepID=A0A397IFV1_9GLOM|nr:hypothetical protein Glove_243g79 [Diversispora epigaea]
MASTSHLEKDIITSIFYVHLPPDITPENHLPVVIGSCESLGEWNENEPKIILSLQPNSTLWKSDPVTIPLNTHIEYKYATFCKEFFSPKYTFESCEGGENRLIKFQKNHYDIWRNNDRHVIDYIKFKKENRFRFVDCIYNSVNDQDFKEKIMEFQTICSEYRDYVTSVTKLDFIHNKLSDLNSIEKNFLLVLLGYYMECQNKTLFEHIFNYLDDEKKRTKTAENDIGNQRLKEEVKESNKKVNSNSVLKVKALLKIINDRLKDTFHLKKDNITSVFHVHLPPDITENHSPVIDISNRKIKLFLQPNSTLWKSGLVLIPLNNHLEYKYVADSRFFSKCEGRANRRTKFQRNHYDIWRDNNRCKINPEKLKNDFRFVDCICNSINDQNFEEKIMEFQTICSEHREYVISVTKLDFIRNKLSDLNSIEKNFLLVLLGYYMGCQNETLFEYIFNYLYEENKRTKTAENDIDNQRLKEEDKELNEKVDGLKKDNELLDRRNRRLGNYSEELKTESVKLKVEKTEFTENVDKLKETVAKLNSYNKKLEESTKEQMEGFKAQLEQEKKANEKLVNSLNTKFNELDNYSYELKIENDKLNVEKTELTKNVDKLKVEKTDLTKKVDKLEETVEELNSYSKRLEESNKKQKESFKAQFEQEKEANKKLANSLRKKLNDNGNGYFMLSEENAKLKEEASKYQAALGVATNTRLGDDDLNHSVKLKEDIKRLQTLLENYVTHLKPKTDININIEQIQILVQNYDCEIDNTENPNKLLIKAILQRKVLDFVLEKYSSLLYNHKNDYKDKVRFTHTHQTSYSNKNKYSRKNYTDENDLQFIHHQTSYKDKDENENDDRFLELKIDSKANELLDLINEFSTTREGTDEVIKVSATKTRQQIYGILGNRGFNKIIHDNEIHEHNFIYKVSNELNNMMNSYRKIENVERKNNIEAKAPKLVQNIFKIFLFRLNVQEPKLEYYFYKVEDEIDSDFMAESWDDEIDKLCVDICYFPLIGQNLASKNKKVYTLAKVVARSKNVLQKY